MEKAGMYVRLFFKETQQGVHAAEEAKEKNRRNQSRRRVWNGNGKCSTRNFY